MKKKIVFIVNPISGTHDKRNILNLVKEYLDGHFEVCIATSWYDFEYDMDSILVNQKVTQEELDAQKEWQFSLEDYWNSKYQ